MIYSFGYAGRSPAELVALVERLGAMLVDIRYSPRSRDPRWSGAGIRRAVGDDRYIHCRSLGNRAYKTGGAIDLDDPERAVEELRPILAQRPVILLCLCRDYRTCHRTVAAEHLAGQLGATIEHL